MTAMIPPEFEQFVQQQVAAGEYSSAEDVVTDGLRVLRELKARHEAFRRDVQIGVDQLDRGEGIKVEQDQLRAFFDDIQARGQARYEASRQRS